MLMQGHCINVANLMHEMKYLNQKWLTDDVRMSNILQLEGLANLILSFFLFVFIHGTTVQK